MRLSPLALSNPAIVSRVGIVRNAEGASVLQVRVDKGTGFPSGGGDFFKAMKGPDVDKDSCQVAIRWTDDSGNDAGHGHDTNAKSGYDRPAAAEWEEAVSGSTPYVWWNMKRPIPATATHVEVVLVYTDLLFMPPDVYKDPVIRVYGDMPAIVARWTGDWDKEKHVWEFERFARKAPPR